MPMTPLPLVTLTPVAYFAEKYFLENLAVRADGSVLITAVLQKELWYVPGPEPRTEVSPVLVHTFDHLVMGIAEAELTCGPRIGSPDVRRIMPSLAGQVSCKLQSKTSVS
jgi:hypothetical protein